MSNHFSMSENEYNRLRSVLGQLSLINSLLITNDSDQACEIVANNLQDFVSTQEDTIRGIIRALDARYEEQRGGNPLNWIHWSYALKIASGDTNHVPQDAEKSVSKALATATLIDEDMGYVLSQWVEILGKQKPANKRKSAAA